MTTAAQESVTPDAAAWGRISDDGLPGILLITARADVGGGPEHVYQLLKALGRRYRMFVAAPQEAPYWERYAECVGHERMLAIPHRSVSIRTWMSLATFIRKHRIQIVHSHGYCGGLLGRPTALLTRAAAIHSQHGMFFLMRRSLTSAFRVFLERQWVRRDAATIFVSDDERLAAQSVGIHAPRARVITNGVDPALPEAAPKPTSERLRIVNVNRFDACKNPFGLLDILAATQDLLDANDPQQRMPVLDVYGDGELRAAFLQRAAHMGLAGHVRTLGNVPDLRARLPAYDLMLSCSRWEGLPIAVLEAMACGLPVLLSRVVGHGDLLRQGLEEAGFESGDAAAAARRLVAFQDPELRMRLGTLGPAIVARHYTKARMIDAVDDCYKRVLAAAPAGAHGA